MARSKSWTERRRKAVEAWVGEAKALIGLTDWTITNDWGEHESMQPTFGAPTVTACISPFPSSKHAIMYVSLGFLDLPEEEQRQTLTHELVHCHLFSIDQYVKDSFEVVVEDNEVAKRIFEAGLSHQIELLTDGLADVLASRLPRLDLA